MGCDIHLYREKQVNGQWVSADKWTAYDYGDDDKGQHIDWKDRAFTTRNYELFGVLSAGVRSEHPFSFAARGRPLVASPEVIAESDRWGVDGHSHSYLYLHELRDLAGFLEKATIHVGGMKDRNELAALHASIASGAPNWELLFPYCRSTNDPKQDDFEIDVPASFYMGDSLKKIIESFDGIDGDNHRIVFFFDN